MEEYRDDKKSKLYYMDEILHKISSMSQAENEKQLDDEGFYVFGESRYKPFGVKWGEFYRVCGADWKNDFPDAIFVSKQPHDALSHYLFYFRDGAFECVAKNYDLLIDFETIFEK